MQHAWGARWGAFHYCLFLLIVLTVSRVHAYLGVASARPALLLTGAAVVFAFLDPKSLNLRDLFSTWPGKVMLGLGLMACISAPFGLSLGSSARFILEVYLKVLVLAFLIIAAVRTAGDVRFLVWAYVLGCGILVVIATVVVGISKTQGMATFDANDVGLVLVIGLPLTLVTFQTSGRLGKVVSLLIMVGIGVTLAVSRSRGGFLGLIAVGLGLLILSRHVPFWKRFAFVGLVAAGLFVAAPEGYWDLMETTLRPTEDYNWTTTYGRKKVALRGLGYMLDNPLTGIGINNFPRAEGTLIEHAQGWRLGDPRIKWSAAHNSFVQVGAELGVPGILLFGGLVFGGMIAMARLRRRLPRRWDRGGPDERFLYSLTRYMPISLLGFAVAGSFLSFAYLDPVYILGALMAGIYIAARMPLRRARAVTRVVPGRPREWPRPVAARQRTRPVAKSPT